MKLRILFAITAALALAARAENGFTPLFNGKDLTGWEGLDGFWSVVDGAIQGSEQKETSKQTNLILTESKNEPGKYGNFELRYSWRLLTPGGNSGMQIRGVVDKPDMNHVGGYQADIDAVNQHTGIIYDEAGVAGKRGIMSNRGEKTLWDAANKRFNTKLEKSSEELKKSIKPQGEWNDCIIIAEGSKITYRINGETMTELTDESPHARSDGVIGIQLHGGHTMTIQFKDLHIRRLP